MKNVFIKIKNRFKSLCYSCCLFFRFLWSYMLLHLKYRDYLSKEIWLIREKPNEARDNGFHFFKYLREKHPEIHAFFVISEDASDYSKVKKYGNIVKTDSVQHTILYLACKYSVSSQAYGAYPFQMSMQQIKMSSNFCKKDQKVIFLQHGIIKDGLSHLAFDANKCNIDYFVTSTDREYEFIKQRHGYPEKNIGCPGLCRHDNLLKEKGREENLILIMPTWRMWLGGGMATTIPTESEKKCFSESEFYNQYVQLMRNNTIRKLLDEYDFRIVFYMHYQIQKYTELFDSLRDERIIIADKESYDVQDLMIRSKIMITDYSSVFFDFAYMKKPLIYFQFDQDQFYANHYQKGYFSFYDDGFGPVCHNCGELVDELKNILEKNCHISVEYEKRIDDCFKHRDGRNCVRTFEDIIKL